MATNTYVALDKITVTGSAATDVTFSNINQGYTDLVLVINGYGSGADGNSILVQVGNGSVDTGSNYSYTALSGNGTTAYSDRGSSLAYARLSSRGGLSNSSSYPGVIVASFLNYSNTSTYKTLLSRCNLPGTSYPAVEALVSLWRSTSAINTVKLYPVAGESWAVGTTFSLYGIKAEGALTTTAKATGGTITYDDFSFYHTFTASGTFTPTQSLTCDVLTVAGGGAGGVGGGGAGGVLAFANQKLSSTGYTVTVGGGGTAGGYGTPSLSTAGVNSSFGSLTAAIGGGKGAPNDNTTSVEYTGGSGGGGGGSDSRTTTAGLGTSGQGNNGGTNGGSTGGPYPAGGGGGYGAVGSNAASGNGGAGGIGANSVPNWGSLAQALTTTSTGVSGRLAAGGGGGINGGGTSGAGGTGGGGAGGYDSPGGVAGTVNTGSGGGGSPLYQGAGGSGLVIVRYPR
jgi:hypothetical protein